MRDSCGIASLDEYAASDVLPLLDAIDSGTPIAWRQQKPISRDAFLNHVLRVAECLPRRRYALNLCQDRYLFLLAFAAAGVCGQTSLLPASRARAAIAETSGSYPDSHIVDDEGIGAWVDFNVVTQSKSAVPWLPAGHAMAVAFTSGSTGRAQPHVKRWGELVAGARLAERRFAFALAPGASIVATVPPQHMYGLETSIMLPLTLPVALDAGRPLLPEDVLTTLAALPEPRVLVTTPAHLRVLTATPAAWPALRLVISATAPLSPSLARAAEAVFAAPVMEIYGCTEAGSIASRRTIDEDAWKPYDGFTIDDGWARAAHLAAAVRLNDQVEVFADGRFALGGREQDLVNVAGKRTSLSFLNRILNEIDGVDDGVFVVPEEGQDRPRRLAALVASTTRSKREILAALAERIDPIFLPRPLRLIKQLPRNEVGKLRRQALLDLLAQT